MCYVIITGRSLLWILVSLIALLCNLSSLVSPAWLVAPYQTSTIGNETVKFRSSVGVYTKCRPMNDKFECSTVAVRGLATESHVFPTAWKAAMIFIAFGLTIMTVTVVSGVFSCCFQSIFKKSIFTLSGATQAVAGIFYIIGVTLHPMAWDASRVKLLCGREASPFYPDNCSFGWGLWSALIGTALTFLSACLSVPAEKSTSSDKVQDQIHEGNTLICLA